MMHGKTIAKKPVLQPPFLQPQKWTDKATWQRLGHGLIALCDATDEHMIDPGMVLGVTNDDGRPVLNRYWPTLYTTPARSNTPLSYSYIFNGSYHSKLTIIESDVNLCDVLTEAVTLYQNIEIYTAADWWAEFSCLYDPHTNTARFYDAA